MATANSSNKKPDQPRQADFDLDAWVDGTTGVTGVARILQRGDLLAKRDRLRLELEVARKIPPDQRGVNDRGPEVIKDELDAVYAELAKSILYAHVQDRTEGRRDSIRDRLKKRGVTDPDTVGLHVVADAIVKLETPDGQTIDLPDGFPPEKLRKIRDQGGDSTLLDLFRVFQEVTSQAPTIQAPLSRGSSSTRAGTTSL